MLRQRRRAYPLHGLSRSASRSRKQSYVLRCEMPGLPWNAKDSSAGGQGLSHWEQVLRDLPHAEARVTGIAQSFLRSLDSRGESGRGLSRVGPAVVLQEHSVGETQSIANLVGRLFSVQIRGFPD